MSSSATDGRAMVCTTSPGLKDLVAKRPRPAPSMSDLRISTFIFFSFFSFALLVGCFGEERVGVVVLIWGWYSWRRFAGSVLRAKLRFTNTIPFYSIPTNIINYICSPLLRSFHKAMLFTRNMKVSFPCPNMRVNY